MSLLSADALPVEPLDALRKVSQSERELDELRWTQIAQNVAANADLSEDEAMDLAVGEVRDVRRSRRSH